MNLTATTAQPSAEETARAAGIVARNAGGQHTHVHTTAAARYDVAEAEWARMGEDRADYYPTNPEHVSEALMWMVMHPAQTEGPMVIVTWFAA